MHGRTSPGPLYWFALAVCLLAGCAASVSRPTPQPAAEPVITRISIERRCFGCGREMRLTLTRAGQATRETFGSARQGTKDQTFTGAIAPREFDDLARLVLTEGFLELRDEYKDPQVADGEWIRISVTTTSATKTVLAANDAGPPGLRRIEAAAAALEKHITWSAVR